MKIRKAVINDVKEFCKLADYCFGDPYNEDTIFEEQFDPEITTVVIEDDKLVGGYIVYPFDVTYGGSTVSMGGISCVTIDVHTRYKGYAKKMLSHMIEDMHNKGMVFSALGAFNFQFYRKLGWEVTYDRYLMDMDINILKDYLFNDYTIDKNYDIPIDKVMKLQTDFSKRYNGYIPRSKKYWEDYEKHYRKNKYLFGTVSLEDDVKGYVIYKLDKDNKISVRELVYDSHDSLKALLGFIYRHNAQKKKVRLEVPTDFPIKMMIADQYKIEPILQTVMMNRIVDVKKAFELGIYPNIGEHSIALKVTDEHGKWNDGIWHIYLSQGNITAEKVSGNESFDAEINITELSQMLLGYASGSELLDIQKIKLISDEASAFINNVFLKKMTYMNNRF